MGARLVAPVMLVTFIAAFVPIVGAVVAGLVAVLVALVTAGSTQALIVAAVALLVQQLDNDILAPVVYGRALRLHPLVVLLGIGAGGSLFGLVGTFLAVPVIAVVVNVLAELRPDRRVPIRGIRPAQGLDPNDRGHARSRVGVTEEESEHMTMWDYGTDFGTGDRDVVGYDVEATDGSIGKIDEASYDAGQAYLVVDTGFWIFGKKRMIPAGVVERVDDEDRKVFVRLSKDEIKAAPDFEEEHRATRDEYDTYYEPYRG